MGALWPLSAARIREIVGGDLRGDPDATASRVNTDSRSGVRVGDCFVGLVGAWFDGGRFAADALADGATVAVISADADPPPLAPGQAVVAVPDPLAALQALAAEARARFEGTVVAVTGSNGKTMVKDMLAAALGAERRVSASPMSYNSQVGVALALLGIEPDAEVAVIECGISRPGEMARLEAMVRPHTGILTNVGDAHLEGLGSRQVTAREKASLFGRARGPVFVPSAQALAVQALRDVGADVVTVERDGDRVVTGGVAVQLPIDDAADFLLDDAALAAACAVALGARPQAVETGLTGWTPPSMRLEMSTTPRGVFVVNDAYTADPESVDAALRVLQRERTPGRAVAVLGGMAQLGVARADAHERVGRRLVELGVDRLIGVGPGGREIARAAERAGMERVHAVDDVAEAATVLEQHVHPGDRVLLKGSRPDRLERLSSVLFEAVAPARLYVDLDAVVGNYHRVRRAIGPGCGVMAMVKAFGYGLDGVRIATALERAGAEHLAVAYPDEGVDLRLRGLTRPILVQNVLAGEVHKIVQHGLSGQVSDPGQVRALADEAARQQRAVRVHLKVDTGMGRAGCLPEQAPALAAAVAAEPWLRLDGLMSHFPAADDPSADAFTRAQIARFDGVVRALADRGVHPRWVHLCNSAGVARFPEAHYDMVRVGIGLFGYAGGDLGWRSVLRLVTRVVSVKELPAEHFVGYGLTWRTPAPRRVAVVALGYNDGYPWSLSNRGWMRAGGGRCPVVGRVCMDVTMLDVTDAPEPVHPGDEVVVFGPDDGEPSVEELSELAGTIPYELLTRISTRVRRIYEGSAQ